MQLIAKHAATGDSTSISNPCGFSGHSEQLPDGTIVDSTGLLHFTLTSLHFTYIVLYSSLIIFTSLFIGSAELCVQELKILLWPNEDCTPGQACPLDGIEHPKVKHDFYGMSVYFFAFDSVRHFLAEEGIMPNWPNPSVAEMKKAAHSFCSMDWSQISSAYETNKHPYTRSYQLSQRCVEALYIVTLIEHGFGFDADSRGITIALEVEGSEVEWTLGYALSEVVFDDDEDDEDSMTQEEFEYAIHQPMNITRRKKESSIWKVWRNVRCRLYASIKNVIKRVHDLFARMWQKK